MLNKRNPDRKINKVLSYACGWIVVRLANPSDLLEYIYSEEYNYAFNSIVIRKSSNYANCKRIVSTLFPLKDGDIEYILRTKENGVIDSLACNRFLKKKEYIDELILSDSVDILSKLAGNVNLLSEHVDALLNTKIPEVLFNLVKYHHFNQSQINLFLEIMCDKEVSKKPLSYYVAIWFLKNQDLNMDQCIRVLTSYQEKAIYLAVIRQINAKNS